MRQAILDWLGTMAMGWLWRQLGVARWLRERALHVPQAALPALALETATRAGVVGKLTQAEMQAFWSRK